MYLVVSRWEAIPGHEEEFEETGRRIVPFMREQNGVEFFESMKSGHQYLVVHGYRDERTYHRLIDNPQGDFARLIHETGAEIHGRWIGSEKGETLEMASPSVMI